MLGQTIPQQLGTFQQGNVLAQQALTQGLPQIQAAILGQPVNLGQFQPQTVPFQAGFAQQQLPAFPTVQQAFEQPTQQPGQPALTQEDITRLIQTNALSGGRQTPF